MQAQTEPVPDPATTTAISRTVVAVVLTWRGRIGLFRRSRAVDHDAGAWHCITGYVEPHTSPLEQALLELHEETGVCLADLTSLVLCDVLELPDAEGNVWAVHTFAADTGKRRVVLNEEHDGHRWVRPSDVRRFTNRVSWLDTVIESAAHGSGQIVTETVPKLSTVRS
jgi:8-oxo-dGTP pyrophosphatase MutT (NUDIX family)